MSNPADPGFRVGTRSPMVAGGVTIPETVAAEHPSIWKQSGNFGPPRVHLPKLNPKYPETKHTVKKVIHNISQYTVSDDPGTESYDPVLFGGKSLVDHYPYAAITPKETLVNPLQLRAEINACETGAPKSMF